MEVLNPISSQTTYSNGGNLVPSALKISKSSNTYIVEFATISNTPDNVESSKDVLVIKANFSVANQPLILSGRNFEIVSSVSFPGGTLTQTVKFAIVGPLLKPLLQLVKSFQVYILFYFICFLFKQLNKFVVNRVSVMVITIGYGAKVH